MKPLKVFISYSKHDKAHKETLLKHLAGLRGQIVTWDDQDLRPGEEWDAKIKQELGKADMVLYLVTHNSIATSYIQNTELPLIKARCQAGECKLVPVIVDFCHWEDLEFAKYNALPDKGVPMTDKKHWSNENEAWTNVVKGIKSMIVDLGKPAIAQTSPSVTTSTIPETLKPEVPYIHGVPIAQVQALQREAAQALGLPVVFRHPLQSGGEGPEMAVIPAGSFLMGSPGHEPGRYREGDPQHRVDFAQPFALGVYAVTFDEYDQYCQANGKLLVSDAGWGRGRRPVINVSWNDAVAYCDWLSAQTGRRYRLPSEAEWEYACRAGTTTPFHWGSTINPSQANYNGINAYNGGATSENRRHTLPVGQFAPNAFGLYDLHGNVWEWCQDFWHDSYRGAPGDGRAWLGNGVFHVVRGGSWNIEPRALRSANRTRSSVADNGGGFRLAS